MQGTSATALSRPQRVEVRVARTADDMARVMAIRAAVFLGEEDTCTYSEEFDGNDFAATHLLALVDGDAAGVFRIRWFADFARLERLGIRKRYRRLAVLNALTAAALELARQKGYRLVSGKPREEVVSFWRRLGGRIVGQPAHTDRGTLIPVVVDVPRQAGRGEASGTLLGDHDFEFRINRPEGEWDFDEMLATALDGGGPASGDGLASAALASSASLPPPAHPAALVAAE
jgi:hypothetical protein